ncbi:Exoenzymes regulatory protein AepA precursor [Pseudoalteromonas luteoviolacea B = ATCC 29581]|nr:Exoenzymes regulatory protein AepA precursor [Pseudoalteromonas luteoviolacea B = ATCC 29581]
MTPLALTLSCALSACGAETQLDAKHVSTTVADLVIHHAQVYTVNEKQPWADSIAIKDGKIIYVGSDDNITAFIGSHTDVRNLQGKMVLPGLHDVHIHPLESASDATHFTVPEYATIVEYQDQLINAAAKHPSAKWLIGYGHNIDGLLTLGMSPRELLDEVISDKPVIIMEQTSHSMWVNSRALELANLHAESRDPIGGALGRTAQGELDGILYDNAGNGVMDIAMLAIGNESERNYQGFVDYTQPELLKHGVTSISDARVYWQRGQLETWQQLAKNDALSIRVSLGLWAYPEASDETQIAQLKSLYQINQHPMLKVDQIKIYMDGILVNTTAALKAPYKTSWLELEGDKGLNYFTQARLEKYLKALEPVGFDFNIHGIGDRGIHEALNAIEHVSSKQHRHRITHVEVVDPKDYNRFAKLGVIADAQVAGDFTDPSHWPEMTPLLGDERANDLVPIKNLLDNGATLTLSSDWNVSTLNPFIGIANAISRAPQAISLEEAIRAYTLNGAYAMRQETQVGSLEVGKAADFIILDKNLFDLTPAQIRTLKVNATFVAGEQVY